MNIHKNARLTPLGRLGMVRRIVNEGWSVIAAAEAAGISERTARKWLSRYRQGGTGALTDRSSRPHRLRQPTPAVLVERVKTMRHQRQAGRRIALETGLSPATVSRILRRLGLSRISAIDPPEPVQRYEYDAPGELIHLDIKKLGRFARPGHRVTGDRHGQSTPRAHDKPGFGWEYVHVCIDDHSRIAKTDLMPDEKADSAVKALDNTIAYYKSLGITVQRVMTDNGSCYKSHAFRRACLALRAFSAILEARKIAISLHSHVNFMPGSFR